MGIGGDFVGEDLGICFAQPQHVISTSHRVARIPANGAHENLRVILAMTVEKNAQKLDLLTQHHPQTIDGIIDTIIDGIKSSSSSSATSKIEHTMQPNNRKNKPQTQDKHNNRINPQTRALISIQLQHGPRRATGTSRARRGRPDITQGLLMVRCGTTAHRSARTAGGRRRGRAADGGAGSGCAGASACGLGVGAGLGAGGQRGGGTEGGLGIE